MRTDPVGHELARHDQLELARVGVEAAQLGGLQPAIEGAGAAIAAKASADRFPCRRQRRVEDRGSAGIVRRNLPYPLHFVAPPLSRSAGTRKLARRSRVAAPAVFS